VYTIYNYIIGEPWEHDIGNSKIGGAYIPADTLITLEYTNGSTGLDKELSGKIQYLY
jgi:acyl-CoA synthetase (AMP-forming)/AMP-acid ligase II